MTQQSAIAPQFDTGPLSWVIGEIRDALERSAKALHEASGRSPEAQPTLLLHAKSHLHQAHGALQMVDVHGVERLTEAAEQAIDRFKDGGLAVTKERADTVGQAYQALVEYLEELLDGALAPQPARLFPYYRALQEMLGAERVHPGDLLVLETDPALPPAAQGGDAPDVAACRARFEKALLLFMRSATPEAQREQGAAMRDALAPIVQAQTQPRPHAFWLALQTVADLAAQGQLAGDVYLKQLFGQINLQLRRMAQGHTSLPDPVLRDALFFIAQAAEPTPDARALAQAWGIQGQVPHDYLERRYGRIDQAALKDAKAALLETKEGWDRIASADTPVDPQDSAFDQALAKLAGASEKLGAPALAQLLRELGQAASESVAGARTDQFSMEMAEAMLFVEHGLDQVRQLPEDFGQHAEAVGQRLLALAHGETPPDVPQWQGELARELQQGQTVAVLAGEIRTGLRQVEKLIDEYYENAGKRAALDGVDPILHQLQGALAILDQDQAARAVTHVRAAVRALADGQFDAAARAASLDNLAQNVGALGFFTDALAQNVDNARKRFRFDAQAQLLRELPFDAMGEPVVSGPDVSGHDAGQAPEPVTEPASAPMSEPVAQPVAQPVAEPAADDGAIEAELLEIFIGEAQEVLAMVGEMLPSARANPADQETLTRLRRGFHTLKGSGRMVGLEQFAGVAAAVEKCMNLWLAEARAATPDLLALIEHAHAELSAWVAELATDGRSARDGAALAAAAARVQEGGPFTLDDAPAQAVQAAAFADPDVAADLAAAPAPAPTDMVDAVEASDIAAALDAAVALDTTTPAEQAELPVETGVPETEPEPEAQDAFAPPAGIDAEAAPEPEPDAEPEPLPAQSAAQLPDNVLAFPQDEDNVKRVGDLEIPLPLYNIYLGESEELLRVLAADFADWRLEPLRAVSAQALKAAHTLGGTSATVGFQALRDIATMLEAALQVAVPPLSEEQFALLDETVERVRIMLQVFGLGELAPAQPELLARLEGLRDELGRLKADAVFGDGEGDPELAARLDELFARTYESILADPPLAGGALPQPLDTAPAPRAPLSGASDTADVDDLFDTYFDDPFGAAALEQAAPPAPADEPDAFAEPEALAESEELAEPEALAEPEELAEPEALIEPESPLEAEARAEAEPPAPAATEPASTIEPAAESDADADANTDTDADAVLASEPVFADELDPDLLPVFMEEASDLLPQIGNDLRQWQQSASSGADGALAQGLLRALHTVKGSARMAGAMRLGQHTHALETQIENMVHAGTTSPAAFDELLANYDQAMLLFEQLQQPPGAAPAQEPTPATAGQAGAPAREQAKPAPVEDSQAARTPLVRVRADILDRLVNQAGEVSITRSRLENGIGTLKNALNDFSDNLASLRRQLREVEMQAESQIASRLSVAGEREFDPLEFDRFTRLQELTRMMAESVNDVASLHESLARTVDGAGEDLAAQSRLTRELQRDLMRVRMVPFASLSERLFRVARQTAKETDKRVNLDIRGGAVEIDRGVLERMAAPFEHLLRNAIVHGIEPRARRLEAGKPETGELLIQVSQQGNEVELRFADDGAGLDLDRIRAKARENGLLAEDEQPLDADVAELVFEPGFSTADALTELAGRGVGMDVVRSEARALGGRVDVATQAGQGASFTIHLPLTLAVTQVVLVASGGRTHALPANLVDQVLQVREHELEAARASGGLTVQGETLPLHYLPELLREPGAPDVQRSHPVLLLKSSQARIALQVDEVLGNREVVVKNIGPQLARMPGIVGATVLGSGEIVLILDPPVLAGQAGRHAVAHPEATQPAAPAPQVPTVMVVDDSLTVRKVTQRLLEREGYRVLLAKDGVDALEQMQDTRPDLMLVDIEMPRMDGFDLTRNVRGNQATHAIPIVMITSRTADKHRNYALGLGVDAYFGKPYQEDVLLAAMAGLLGREI
ncbi:Hpt domain-containing protein [Massilia sp. 9096]|uniref:hybrid sensor histidine kinase/response regulator n=1 Tax=Massilia sp. 9096 TaxID=1500894 RepID=UPI0005609EC4|nr:Hpt domain-containing protein [Massilia sp. 9096]